MSNDRRNFLKLAGLSVIGSTAVGVHNSIASQNRLMDTADSNDKQAQTSTQTMKYKDIPGRPRSSAGFAQKDNLIYWCAGHLGEFHYYGRDHFSREFHYLDLNTNKWNRLSDFPVPAQGFRMCAYDGGVFAFGGFVYEGDGEWPVRSSDVVRRYDIAADKWNDVARLKTPRSSNVIGQVDNLVYLIGGWDGASKPPADESVPWPSKPKTFHDTIEAFDLKTMKTVDVFPMGISQRRAFAAVTTGTDITIACGLGPGSFADLKSEVLTFSTTKRTWTKLFDTPLPLFSPGLAWPGHAPLIIGGLFVNSDYSQYEEFQSISTFYPHGGGKSWLELAKLSSSRTFPETAVWKNELIIVGGHSGLWPVSTVESFNAQHPGTEEKQLQLDMLKAIR